MNVASLSPLCRPARLRAPLLALVVGGFLSSGLAAEPFPSPVSKPRLPEPEKVATDALPEAVRSQIAEISEGPLEAAEVDVIEVDINADGGKELLVFNPMSYTGGQIIWIFAPAKDEHRSLGAIQGSFYLASPAEGWNRIVADARAPGGFIRTLYAFRDGTYRSVREAEYEIGENDTERFVRELTPRE